MVSNNDDYVRYRTALSIAGRMAASRCSYERKMAINPLAPDKLMPRFHEIAHIVLGHMARDKHAKYVAYRSLFEFQAEAVAYLAMHELGVEEPESAAESRAYIPDWLAGDAPSDDSAIRAVFVATDLILRLGR